VCPVLLGMATMDPVQVQLEDEEGLSREELEKALSGHNPQELQEMARRLGKSQEQFQEMLTELEAESDALKEENRSLNDTITMMMKEMQKLNIGADNTVEPMLDEGPLDFVGRFWEKVKPRNSAVVISEHVGEIKKPGEEELQNPLQQQGKQVVQNLRETLGPIWQRAETLVKDAKGEIAKKTKEIAEKQQLGQLGQKPQKKRERRAERAGTENASQAAASGEVASAGPSEPISAPEEATEKANPEEAPVAAAVSEGQATEESEAAAAVDAPGNEEISSTILIEAKLKIDDGSTQTLYVRAADRCKEVAQRFVMEHSLKAWFQEPLTAWLKKVEADAVKFPVVIEGDLMEIRKQHSKNK